MADTLDKIREQLHQLQEELEEEYRKRRDAIEYTLRNGRVKFTKDTRRLHRAQQIGLWRYLRQGRALALITAPVIYALILPFSLLHLMVWIYQAICFPAYGIPKVPMRAYIRIDRHQLSYLNLIQKLNCVYCGYCNGVTAWVREIASRTEAHWCPIKHASRVEGTHERYAGFVDYGDAEGYVEGLRKSRDALRK